MGLIYREQDIQTAALCIWRESRGEKQAGMQAVAHVIFNRVGAVGFPKTLHDVIYQKNAFTSMSVPSDPEYSLMPQPNDPQYAYALQIANAVASGTDADPTQNSHYYENAATATSGWFGRVIAGVDGNGTPDHPLRSTIGKQNFYL